MTHFENAIARKGAKIEIVSGEGVGQGTAKTFTGRRTMRAIMMAIRKEECGGDRWAFARVAHPNGGWVRMGD